MRLRALLRTSAHDDVRVDARRVAADRHGERARRPRLAQHGGGESSAGVGDNDHLRTAGNVLLELVNILGDAPPRLVLAEAVGQVDVDGLGHGCDVEERSALFKLRRESIIAVMRALFFGVSLVAAPAAAQTVAPAPIAPVAQPEVWDPASPYIAAGQDEPGYRSWYLSAPWRAGQVKAFNDYLVGAQVAGIVPTWQLLRTATAWKDCGGQPFEIPPPDEWPHMIQTLRYIRDYVIPAVGPVEPVSAYRNPTLNVCAGGAPESAHMHDSAIDLVPLRPIGRVTLMRTLCGTHSEHGAAYNAGLGFYAYLRFHVDSTKFRRWNMDPAVAAECPPIVHPEDIASVGQPIQVATPGSATVPPGTIAAPIAAAPSISPGTQAPPPLSQH